MENIWTKLIFFTLTYTLHGTNSLQTLNDLRNALNINALLLPQNPSKIQNPHPVKLSNVVASTIAPEPEQKVVVDVKTPCSCAVFLSGQFTRGSNEQPKGNPALLQELEKVFPCTPIGLKQCQSKCLETIVKHLPNSAEILCATIDRDCHKERAYLFVKNCNSTWQNSNLSAGREYCCKDNLPYTCPLI